MNHFIRTIILPMIATMLLTACEKRDTWNLGQNPDESVVVDGTITSEEKTQEIRLSRPVAYPNEVPGAVSGAEILVSSDERVYHFHESAIQAGVYLSDDVFAGKPGSTYSLLINTGSRILSAKADMVQGFAFVFARYIKDAGSGLLRINWVANPYNAKRPAMYEILLDWSSVPGYENSAEANTHARLLYYTLPTLDVSEIFAPTMETVLFPPGTIITENRYSLTPEHAEYIRAQLSETNWQGGLFNSASANLPTNLSEGGIGYFGACALTSRTSVARLSGPVIGNNN